MCQFEYTPDCQIRAVPVEPICPYAIITRRFLASVQVLPTPLLLQAYRPLQRHVTLLERLHLRRKLRPALQCLEN